MRREVWSAAFDPAQKTREPALPETHEFAFVLLLVAGAGLLALLANRVTQWTNLPAPALVLVAAALATRLIGSVHLLDQVVVQRVVTVALVLILFDGGAGIGWHRLRPALRSVAVLGIGGTFLTAAGGAATMHWLIGLPWYPALLVATAVAATDPAVVFSVLGRREITGHSGTVLEGESGATDPVGIALLAALLAAGHLSGGTVGRISRGGRGSRSSTSTTVSISVEARNGGRPVRIS